MRIKLTFLFSFAFFSISGFCQTYIKNVSVIDVEKQKIIPEQTVMISADKISDIGSSKKMKIPANAVTIDGTGKFLLPGMTDAHVHFFQSGGYKARRNRLA